MTPNERDYEVWDKINLYTKELLSCVVGEIVYELSRTQEPAKTMLAKERQYAAEQIAAYRAFIESPLKDEIERLREGLIQICKRDDWTGGECRCHARQALLFGFKVFVDDSISCILMSRKAYSQIKRSLSMKPAEPERGPEVTQIFVEIAEERRRQDARWGVQNHPVRNDSDAQWLKEQAETYRKICDLKASENRLTWYDIIMEEIFEVFAEDTPERQRAELVQMVTVGVAMVQSIDRCAALERRIDQGESREGIES